MKKWPVESSVMHKLRNRSARQPYRKSKQDASDLLSRRQITQTLGSATLCAVLGTGVGSIVAANPSSASASSSSDLPPLSGTLQTFEVASPRPTAPELPFQRETQSKGLLSDYRGRVVLVNLWATWCAPCVREMPSLNRLQAAFDPDDVLVMPISLDRGGAFQVRKFYEKHGLNHLDIFLDPRANGMRMLAARGVPATVLIDRQGREVGRLEGPAEWDAPEVMKLIDHVRREPFSGS